MGSSYSPLVLLFVLLLFPFSAPSPARSGTVVPRLPGFRGPLPFHLETGSAFRRLPFISLPLPGSNGCSDPFPVLLCRLFPQVRGGGRGEPRGVLLLLHRVGRHPQRGPSAPVAHWRPEVLRLLWSRLRSG
ncbi:hypothetical protein B296_00059072 [Ensete ventricosum]|uniref:Secreted protein n=1 Tax=Ensete ventricosum TaxID=4639 RepID=A0A426XF56_ENSVE|nr:hypothetical protein B296_00059072 [Ensete ventricosum]